jgi:hypothetical protein
MYISLSAVLDHGWQTGSLDVKSSTDDRDQGPVRRL